MWLKGGRDEGEREKKKKKTPDQKRREVEEINGRRGVKKEGRHRRTEERIKGGRKEEKRRWRRGGGEEGGWLSLIIIGLTVGDGLVLLLGGTCVFLGEAGGGRVKRRGHCRDGVHKISRLVLYHRNCSALNWCFYPKWHWAGRLQ